MNTDAQIKELERRQEPAKEREEEKALERIETTGKFKIPHMERQDYFEKSMTVNSTNGREQEVNVGVRSYGIHPFIPPPSAASEW